MKKLISNLTKLSFLLIFLLLSRTPSFGQNSGFGIGLIAGEPTGVSFKNWLDSSTAWDFAVAWSIEGDNSFTLHGDYLKHRFGLFSVAKGDLPLYFGVGGTLKFNDDAGQTAFGARVPVGLDYHFEDLPLGAFLEVVPVLGLFPETDFRLNAAIGIRYFFGSKRN